MEMSDAEFKKWQAQVEKEGEESKKRDLERWSLEIKNEAQLENYFCKKVKQAGGWPIKFNSMGTNGLPDQIIFYKGFTWLVELKTPKGVLMPRQKAIHEMFRLHNFKVRVIRNRQQVLDFIDQMISIEL